MSERFVNPYVQADLRNRVIDQTGDARKGWDAANEFEKLVLDGEDPYQVSLKIQHKYGIGTQGYEPTISTETLSQSDKNSNISVPVGSDNVAMSTYSGGRAEPPSNPDIGEVGSDKPVRKAIFTR